MSRPMGLDASSLVNWGLFGELDFAMVKATEGVDYTAPAFAANWARLSALPSDPPRLARLAYHYFHPNEDPATQAALLTRVVMGAGLGAHDHFVLDLEVTDGMTPMEVSFAAYVFCREVNRLNPGHRVLVYTSPSFAEAGNCAMLGEWFLWVADWGVETPDVPPPWREWTFWQYAQGTIVDYDMYNGTAAELVEFMSHSGGK